MKVYKNLPGAYLGPTAALYLTWLHTIATFLFGVVAHRGAFLFRQNRPMLSTS